MSSPLPERSTVFNFLPRPLREFIHIEPHTVADPKVMLAVHAVTFNIPQDGRTAPHGRIEVDALIEGTRLKIEWRHPLLLDSQVDGFLALRTARHLRVAENRGHGSNFSAVIIT